MSKQQTVVTYKGHQYHLVWSGSTKYGDRSKLRFLNGGKEFWVDSSLVTSGAPNQSSSSSNNNTNNRRKLYRRKYGWDGVVGSESYYSSGLYDEES